MKLPKYRSIWLKIGVPVAAVTVIAGLGFLWWNNTQRAMATTYHSNVVAYANDIILKIATANTSLKVAQAKNDTAQTLGALDNLQTALAASKAPTKPAAVNKADSDHAAVITVALQNFATNQQAERAFLTYSQAVSAAIGALPTKAATTVTVLQQNVAGWQQAVDALKALTPPQSAADVHQQLVAAVDNVRNILAALAQSFAANDYAGFMAQKPQLAPAIASVQSLANTYKNAALAQDQALAASYQKLTAIIKQTTP
ncbi:MAG TPA: hypothetical protein VLG40_04675 [Candidatus Saccharimonas sp.]|nr:hypothetical protein [Candidatus Saccharimonas sp.]